MSIEDDRNLLFGVLAMQLRGVSPAQLARCASSWASDRSDSLSDYLVAAGFLRKSDCEFLNRLVDEAIAAHNGDVQATIAGFGGAECIDRTFLGQVSFGGDEDATIERKGIPLAQIDDSVPAVEETPGRYTSVSEYARGGMGRVLLVYDEHIGREVAMKELLPFAAQEDETLTPRHQALTVVSRFLQEARLTGQLEHPSIIPVYELGRHEDGSLYYTMKLVRGQTLSDVLKRTTSLTDRLALLPHFLDMCQAMAYAHSRGIIHRDIKPGNIMIGEFGETVVLDWGLAKSLKDDADRPDNFAETLRAFRMSSSVEATQTTYGQVLGTPVYMPPEQAKGDLDQIDERSDVYSLGAVLYEILAGKGPYERGKPKEVLQKVLSDRPAPILSIESLAPPELVAICNRAMERDRTRRYTDAKELASEITRFQTGSLVAAYRYSLGDYLRRWVKRHKTVALTAAASTLLIIALTVVYVLTLQHKNVQLAASRNQEQIQRVNAEQARDRAERQQYVATIRLAAEHLDSHHREEANEALWSTPEYLRNWEWGYLLNRANEPSFNLPGPAVATFSPDGKQIATVSREEGAKIWDAHTGKPLGTIEDSSARRIMGVCYSPDGSLLALGGMDGNIRLWNVKSRELVATLGPRRGVVLDICFNRSGTKLLATAQDSNVEIWDVKTKARTRRIPNDSGLIPRAAFCSDGSLILITNRDSTSVWAEDSENPRIVLQGKSPVFRPGTHDLLIIQDSQARCYDADTGSETGFRLSLSSPIQFACYSPDGTKLALCGLNGKTWICDAADGRMLAELNHGGTESHAVFSPDSTLLLTYTNTGVFTIWHVQTGTMLTRYTGHTALVQKADFSPDSTHFLSLGLDHVVHIWNARRAPDEVVVADIGGGLPTMCVSSKLNRIALTSNRPIVHVLNYKTNAGVAAFSSFDLQPYPVFALSPDGTLLCTANDSYTPLLWHIDERTLSVRITNSSRCISQLAFSPDSTRLAIGYWDGTLRLFDVSNGAELLQFDGHGDAVTALTFLPDGTGLISGARDGSASIWDLATGTKSRDLVGHDAEISSIAVTPDGQTVYVAARDDDVLVWTLDSGTARPPVMSPIRTTYIALLPELDRVYGLDKGSRVGRLWTLADPRELVAISGYRQVHSEMYYDAGQSAILTASLKGIVCADRAAPWKPDRLPGEPTLSWRDRYETYRKNMESAGPSLLPYSGATELVVATPRTILAYVLQAIDDLYKATPAAKDQRPPEVDSQLAENLQYLGIRAGDRLIKLEGVDLLSSDGARTIEQARQDVSDGTRSTVELNLERGDRSVHIVYYVLAVADLEDRVDLSSEELREDLVHCLTVQTKAKIIFAQQNDAMRTRIAQLPEGTIEGPGVEISGGSNATEKRALAAIHLQYRDRILQIGDTQISTFEDLLSSLARTTNQLESGDKTTTEIVLMRGPFQWVRLTLAAR